MSERRSVIVMVVIQNDMKVSGFFPFSNVHMRTPLLTSHSTAQLYMHVLLFHWQLANQLLISSEE